MHYFHSLKIVLEVESNEKEQIVLNYLHKNSEKNCCSNSTIQLLRTVGWPNIYIKKAFF